MKKGGIEVKIFVLAAMAFFVLCLPAVVRKQTEYRKQKISKLAEHIGINNLFD